MIKERFPYMVKYKISRLDDGYFIANSEDDLLDFCYAYLKHLDNHSEIYEEEPIKDKYPEITDEYIENAPNDHIKYELEQLKEKRKKWLKPNGWIGTIREEKQIYQYYTEGLAGSKKDAYYYLNVRKWVELISPITLEQYSGYAD